MQFIKKHKIKLIGIAGMVLSTLITILSGGKFFDSGFFPESTLMRVIFAISFGIIYLGIYIESRKSFFTKIDEKYNVTCFSDANKLQGFDGLKYVYAHMGIFLLAFIPFFPMIFLAELSYDFILLSFFFGLLASIILKFISIYKIDFGKKILIRDLFIITIAFALIFAPICSLIFSEKKNASCRHESCKENGPFPCYGKNNTCRNTTSCYKDLYCDNCD